MGFGDEILALGRAEEKFLETGRPVGILDQFAKPRRHDLWARNPAWSEYSVNTIVDGPKVRPYIKRWEGNRTIFNLDYRPRAGHIHLTQDERDSCEIEGEFAVISPHLKKTASVNKDYGAERWAKVIEDFPLPVYQLVPDVSHRILPGARAFHTPTMRHAAAVVARSSLVMTNEGGMHHLAASMGIPAVVVFGGFAHPLVTGYESHANLTDGAGHIGCGRWEPCPDCKKAMAQIEPSVVKRIAEGMIHDRLASKNLRWF